MFLTFKLLARYTSWLVFLLPSSGIPLTKDRNHYLVATHGNFIDNVRVQTPTSFNCKEPSVLINFANIVSSPHKHVASSCHSHPTETEFLKYTVSFVQLCESLPSKSPFGKRCMRWCRHSQWWTSNISYISCWHDHIHTSFSTDYADLQYSLTSYCSRQFLWLRDQLADLFYLTLASHIIARAVAM